MFDGQRHTPLTSRGSIERQTVEVVEVRVLLAVLTQVYW
jgi:hypothetical protein